MILPGADTSRWYADKYPGMVMTLGPDTILFHTTETPSLPGYGGGASAPQATFDVKRRKVWQHFPANMSARALENRPGGVETNRTRVFQIEVVGYSDRGIARSIGRDDLWVGNFTTADLTWIAGQLAPLVSQYGIPFNLTPRFTKNPRYGLSAPQRMTFDEWRNFSGWTYHAAVPENTHWDSGALDIPTIMQHTKNVLGGDPKDWFDMATEADLRRIVREELANLGNLEVPVAYGGPDNKKPLGFILSSTQHRVRELTRAVFGTPDIVEGQQPVTEEPTPPKA